MQANHKSGFTLVEIMVAVVIIGLLAALAIPAFERVRRTSQNATLASDFRIYIGAIETFAMETGDFPEDSSSGVIPAGFAEYIHSEKWNTGPVIGGAWDVEKDAYGVSSAVGVHRFTVSVDQIAQFDEKYDDGNLTTGKYRQIAADRYYCIIK